MVILVKIFLIIKACWPSADRCLTHGFCSLFFLLALYSHGVHSEMAKDRPDLIHDILKNYDSDVPPGGSTEVKLGILVNSFYAISERTMDYSLNLYLRQQWTDSRLKSNSSSTIKLPDKAWEEIWTPDVAFRNEKESSFHYITRPNRLMYLSNNGEIFYSMKLSLILACPMCLKNFPMDKQICPIFLESFGYTNNTIKFKWINSNAVELEKNLRLPQFQLQRVEELDCSKTYISGTYSCLQINFHLQRDFGYYITEIYVPTLLIIMLSWVGFWISIDAVPARVSLGLLAVLTITTQRSAVGNSLPRVSYTKAVDVWMSTVLVFVFTSFLQFALINYITRKKTRNEVKEEKNAKSTTPAMVKHDLTAARMAFGITPDYTPEVTPMLQRSKSEHFQDKKQFVSINMTNGLELQQPEQATQNETCTCTCVKCFERACQEPETKNEKQPASTEMRRLAMRIDRTSRVAFPVAFLIFNAVYWPNYMGPATVNVGGC